jgi:hypothetical protein
MDKKTLTSLFAEALYQIPDYQRGYAWEEKQWTDFLQDVDALVDEDVTSHYTGTVVVYAPRDAQVRQYGTKRLKVVDIVDGQQRLTTVCLYLSVIMDALVMRGQIEYTSEIPNFLYTGSVCKLTLSNDTGDIFYDLLKNGTANVPVQTPHQKRVVAAHTRFRAHIQRQMEQRGDESIAYLQGLFHAITQKLNFTYYTIEEEAEIGMTFELMNSRGKGLSVLELLKNYLMHWVSRNESDPNERQSMTRTINKAWKDTYSNLGASDGVEDQCLRIAWTLYCSYTPGNWAGYEGFKGDEYIPLRSFKKRSKTATKAYITRFAEGLAEVSRHYAVILSPTVANTLSANELHWLTKIRHTNTLANFLPVMVAARKHRAAGTISEADYIDLLKALECYAYRVYLFERRRSNAGQTYFFRWGADVFAQKISARQATAGVYSVMRWYSDQKSFVESLTTPFNWYKETRCLRYTLFEYELHLLATEGKGKLPHVTWEQLSDSTLEHILPQNPAAGSRWKKVWKRADRELYLHDIGNLVLTHNNSNYLNFEFVQKKGRPGVSPSYSNSDVRQERKIASYADWTPREFQQRRGELVAWLIRRWTPTGSYAEDVPHFEEELDDDVEQDVRGEV